jgi:PilZ domain-containing protein
MLENAATKGERRRARRLPLDLHTRLRHSGLTLGDLTIKDLSFTGFKGETEIELHRGDLISVALPNIGLVRATVQWCDNGMLAAQFQRAVDIRTCFR